MNLGILKRVIMACTLGCMPLFVATAEVLPGNSRYVDPFIGVEGDGNVFPGVCVPFGMMKLGPDCGSKESNSGWTTDGNIYGFSHTHVSGTGGGAKYGNVLVLPLTGKLYLEDYSSPRANEQSVVGEYKVDLPDFMSMFSLKVKNQKSSSTWEVVWL